MVAKRRKVLEVTVEVRGGVAEVTKVPRGVRVEIIDHDNIMAMAIRDAEREYNEEQDRQRVVDTAAEVGGTVRSVGPGICYSIVTSRPIRCVERAVGKGLRGAVVTFRPAGKSIVYWPHVKGKS